MLAWALGLRVSQEGQSRSEDRARGGRRWSPCIGTGKVLPSGQISGDPPVLRVTQLKRGGCGLACPGRVGPK